MKYVALGLVSILCGCASTAPHVVPVAGASGVLLVDYADSRRDYYLVAAPSGKAPITQSQKAQALAKATRYCKHNLSEPEVLPLTTNRTRNVPAIVFQCIAGPTQF